MVASGKETIFFVRGELPVVHARTVEPEAPTLTSAATMSRSHQQGSRPILIYLVVAVNGTDNTEHGYEGLNHGFTFDA